MSKLPTWTDVQHEQTDIELVLPVSHALALSAALPRLLQVLDEAGARTPEDRARQRQGRAAISALVERLAESLRPFDLPHTRTDR
jgi:hypothetical protein